MVIILMEVRYKEKQQLNQITYSLGEWDDQINNIIESFSFSDK